MNVDWLRDNDIVKQLLRANLHQKQYVDQVTPLSVLELCFLLTLSLQLCSLQSYKPRRQDCSTAYWLSAFKVDWIASFSGGQA